MRAITKTTNYTITSNHTELPRGSRFNVAPGPVRAGQPQRLVDAGDAVSAVPDREAVEPGRQPLRIDIHPAAAAGRGPHAASHHRASLPRARAPMATIPP